MGPFWQQPGRKRVEDLLDALPFPSQPPPTSSLISLPTLPVASNLGAQEPTLPTTTPDDTPQGSEESTTTTTTTPWDPKTFMRLKTDLTGRPLGIKKTMTWDAFGQYLRTWSSWHSYADAHGPERAEASLLGFLEELKRGVGEVKADRGGGGRGGKEKEEGAEEEVEVEWPAVIMLAGK